MPSRFLPTALHAPVLSLLLVPLHLPESPPRLGSFISLQVSGTGRVLVTPGVGVQSLPLL